MNHFPTDHVFLPGFKIDGSAQKVGRVASGHDDVASREVLWLANVQQEEGPVADGSLSGLLAVESFLTWRRGG